MRSYLSFLALSVVLLASGLAVAQTPATSGSERKIISRVSPAYPDLAKKMHIQGTVRIEATVRPNGSVKKTRVLGGNPVLVPAAEDAVTKWHFEPNPGETVEIVHIEFGGQD